MGKKIDLRAKYTNQPVEVLVDYVYSEIVGLKDQYTLSKIDQNLSYFVQGYQFTKAYKQGWWDAKKRKWDRWDGKTHLFQEGRFLTGLLHRVERILKANKINYTITDKRKAVSFKRKIKTKNIESRPYQDRVLESCLKHKGGIVQAATGSGKSVMITSLIANSNVKTMVYVIGIDLLYQMKETFEHMLGTEVGIIGDGKCEIKKINVCTVWTAANALGNKYVPFDDEDRSKKEVVHDKDKAKIIKAIQNSELAIFDECQMLAAKTLQLINQKSTAAIYKFGFSGTPYRDDNADLLLEAVCGNIIAEVTASELIQSGYLVKPTIHFVNVPEHPEDLPKNYNTIYRKYIVENEVRNAKIIKAAEKFIEQGRKGLILVKNIKHGKILLDELHERGHDVYFVKGNVKSEERNWIRQAFLNNEIDLLIASVVYDQGVNLPNLDALILAGSGKSTGRALQRLGRVIRSHKGKSDAIVIDFIDNAKYLLEHTHRRIEVYRKEAEFEIKLPKRPKESQSDSKAKAQTTSKSVQKKDKGW